MFALSNDLQFMNLVNDADASSMRVTQSVFDRSTVKLWQFEWVVEDYCRMLDRMDDYIQKCMRDDDYPMIAFRSMMPAIQMVINRAKDVHSILKRNSEKTELIERHGDLIDLLEENLGDMEFRANPSEELTEALNALQGLL